MPKCCQSAGLQSYMTSSGQTLYEQIVTINIKSGSLCGLIRLESLPPRRKKYCLKDEQFLWPRFCFMCRGNCKWIITQYHIRMHKRHASFHNSDCKLFFLQISHKSHQMVFISVPMNPPSCSRQAVFSFSFTFSSTFCHYFTPYPTHSLSPSQLRWFSFSNVS